MITLSNKLNYPAEFTWTPILGERGMAFSIRPATGQVDAFKDLDCEVVFHPSFLAPEEGDFALQIHGGNPLKLKCIAQVRWLFCLSGGGGGGGGGGGNILLLAQFQSTSVLSSSFVCKIAQKLFNENLRDFFVWHSYEVVKFW